MGKCGAGSGGPKKAQEVVTHAIILSCHHTGITGQQPQLNTAVLGQWLYATEVARRGVQ